MKLEHFQYIEEIVKCRSLSKAAKNLYITQPSLSVSIQKLESELGFQILDRSSHGVLLTKKGEEFLRIASEINGHIEKIKNLSHDQEEVPLLHMAAVPACCTSVVMELIAAQKKEGIRLSINLQELRPRDIMDSVLEGTNTIGIGSYLPSTRENIFRKAHANDLVIETLLEDHMAVFLSSRHPLSKSAGIRMDELKDDVPILFQNFEVMDEDYDESVCSHEIHRNYYCFLDRGSVREAIARGLGYSILPYLMALGDVNTEIGKISVVPLLDNTITFGLYLTYPRNAKRSDEENWVLHSVKAICDRLKEQLQQYWNRFDAESFGCPATKIYY